MRNDILMIKSIKNMVFNLKENISHQPIVDDSEIIRQTGLFDNMDEELFQDMLRSVRYKKYQAGSLIFHEGDIGDSLDIIVDGSVRVFTYDNNYRMIPLARLNKGDYFGEQALLGKSYKTRNANIEAIVDTTLLQINEKFITRMFKTDISLENKLRKAGYQQFLKILSSSTGFLPDINYIISQIEKPDIREYSAGELIFSMGDSAHDVYIILEGQVELSIPGVKISNNTATVILHRGHIFGELGVLKNQPRKATATAHTNLRLLRIKDKEFKHYVSTYPQLEMLLQKLQKIYQLPFHGTMQQYIENSESLGSTITNIYKLEDGRSILSSKTLKDDLFTLEIVGVVGNKHYFYKKNDEEIELDVLNNQIVRLKSRGFWHELPALSHLLFNKANIELKMFENFERTGHLDSDESSLGILTDTISWMSAKMKRVQEHGSFVRSYHLKPINATFKAMSAGQHVIIQVKVGDTWIERPYSISGRGDDEIRITIKRDPKGLFAQWLFNEAPDEFFINVSQPRGSFLIDAEDQENMLCFAGGVGIAPFVMYLQSLTRMDSRKKIHVIYSAFSDDDFVFKNELEEIQKTLPFLTVTYHVTNTQGRLNEKDVIAAVTQNNEPDIYICGPEAFGDMICHALETIHYDPDKIHGEKYVHAGIAPPRQ